MKIPAPSAICASLALAFAASASFAQTTPDTPAAAKARKVAPSSVPGAKATAARAGTQPLSTPATTQVSPHEERRFQNCHGKESDA
jgi:hypothetical protein